MPKRQKQTAKEKDTRTNKRRKLRFRRKKSDVQLKKPKKISSSFRLLIDSISLWRQYWKLFGGITVIYLLLSIVLVGGLSGDLSFMDLRQSFTEELGAAAASIALYGLLIGSAGGAASQDGAAYQSLIIVVVSLAVIWVLRQVLAGEKAGLKDAFYKGMYPLVPFLLVVLFLCLLLIPAFVGSFLFSAVFGSALAVNLFEQALWSVLVLLLFVWSLYLIAGNIFALYIVTLPDMKPMAAIRTAKRLVARRRWAIIRKLLFLPLAYIVVGALIIIPLIIVLPSIVQWVFVLLSMTALIFAHIYMYSLYKEAL